MKTDVFDVLEWDHDDIPAVIPKRFWDAMILHQEALAALGDATCTVNEKLMSVVREGKSVDKAWLDEIQGHMSSVRQDFAEAQDELQHLKSLLQWVPPSDFEFKH